MTTWPAGRAAGDLLLIIHAMDGTNTVPTAPAGWTRLFSDITNDDDRVSVFARIASGGSDTFSMTVSGSEAGYFMSWAYSTHGVTNVATQILLSTVAKGDSTSADAPALSLTPPVPFHCVAFYGGETSATGHSVPTAAPSGWTQFRKSTGTGSSAASLSVAELAVDETVNSVNPPAVAVPNGNWLAAVLAVPGT